MDHCNLVQSQNLVKLRKHTFVIIHQIISGIVHMAGVKAYPQSVLPLYFVIDHAQFLEGSADLTALACHGFQCDIDLTVVRVKNKIIRETRKEGLLLLNDDIDLEDVQGELETRAKFMFVPLQRMIDAKEISSAEITVPEGQAETILEDETMRVKIRYVSRGYIREVEVDLGRAQPSE